MLPTSNLVFMSSEKNVIALQRRRPSKKLSLLLLVITAWIQMYSLSTYESLSKKSQLVFWEIYKLEYQMQLHYLWSDYQRFIPLAKREKMILSFDISCMTKNNYSESCRFFISNFYQQIRYLLCINLNFWQLFYLNRERCHP